MSIEIITGIAVVASIAAVALIDWLSKRNAEAKCQRSIQQDYKP